MAVAIRRAAVDDIVRHARSELPNECCGLLVGRPHDVRWTVRARNLRPSATRFLIDPEAHFAAMRSARAVGLSVVGAYHSHPTTSASPSAADLAAASYPDFLYIIVSVLKAGESGDVRAYRLAEGNFGRVDLVLVD